MSATPAGTTYPSTVDDFSDYDASAIAADPTLHRITKAVEAIQTELGTDPAGAQSTVKARLTAAEAGTNVSGEGTAESVTGLTVTEYYAGGVHLTKFDLVATPITVGNTTGVSFGGVQLYTFPSNGEAIYVLNSYGELTFGFGNAGNNTPIDSSDGGDFALGRTAPTDGTLTGTDIAFTDAASSDPLSGGVTLQENDPRIPIAGSELYVNGLIDAADVGDGASDVLELTGFVIMRWVDLGAI